LAALASCRQSRGWRPRCGNVSSGLRHLFCGAAVKIGQRRKARGLATDDRIGLTGRPAIAARIDEFGLPPVASQIGRRPESGRGTTSASFSEGRNLPSQVIFSLSFSFKQQVQLFGIKFVIVVQTMAKQRKALGR
jgi:hypothetical protein